MRRIRLIHPPYPPASEKAAPFVCAGGFETSNAVDAIKSGAADLIAYGRAFLATPDLPKRLKLGLYPNKYKREDFYVPGEKGCVSARVSIGLLLLLQANYTNFWSPATESIHCTTAVVHHIVLQDLFKLGAEAQRLRFGSERFCG
jgi:hypothetical protein